MNKEISAINFYKGIEKEREKYKLVNELFIVKYLDNEISVLVGDFEKSGSVFNKTQFNKIRLIDSKQKFNKKKNLTTTSLGFWHELRIKFEEYPIDTILNGMKGGNNGSR